MRVRVAISRFHSDGEKKPGEVGPDGFFAEMALIDGQPRAETAIPVTDTECLLFTRDTFLRLVEKHPIVSLHLARVLADRLRSALDQTAAPAP